MVRVRASGAQRAAVLRRAGARRRQERQALITDAIGEPVGDFVRAAREGGATWSQISELVWERSAGRVSVDRTTLLRWFPDPQIDFDGVESGA